MDVAHIPPKKRCRDITGFVQAEGVFCEGNHAT